MYVCEDPQQQREMKYLPMPDKRFTDLKFAGGKVNLSFLYGSLRTLSAHLQLNCHL